LAWIEQPHPGANFYLRRRSQRGQLSVNLKTRDRAEAERELARALAEERLSPHPSGRLKWNPHDWQQFKTLRGQSMQQKMDYALCVRTLQLLEPYGDRYGFLLKPVPRVSTLAALGRVSEPQIILLCAQEICELRLQTKPAIRLLRRLRGVERKRPRLRSGP
jgi:hypothetical protein